MASTTKEQFDEMFANDPYLRGCYDGYDAMWDSMMKSARGERDEGVEAYRERVMPPCPLDDESYRRGWTAGADTALQTNCGMMITVPYTYKFRRAG
jgi:hypothetical protein